MIEYNSSKARVAEASEKNASALKLVGRYSSANLSQGRDSQATRIRQAPASKAFRNEKLSEMTSKDLIVVQEPQAPPETATMKRELLE